MMKYVSKLDEARFNIRTVQGRDIDESSYESFREFCIQEKAKLAIIRVNSLHLNIVQKMEHDGFRLMDTLVYYNFRFAKQAIPEDTNNHKIRAATPEDFDTILEMAKFIFKDYDGHYHADPNLPNDKCDEAYIDWTYNSLTSREFAEDVIVVDNDGVLEGFITSRKINDSDGEVVLGGVAPYAQGKGIYRSMLLHGMRWCKQQGADRVVVSTQVTNVAVQKVWARLGFEPIYSYYTLHKWFN